MSGEKPSGKRKRRTRAQIANGLGGNYVESSLVVESIQNNMAPPVLINSLVDVASSVKCAESRVCEGVSQHTSEQVSPIVKQSSLSESTTTTTEKSEFVDFQMAYQLEELEPVHGHEGEGSTCELTTDNTFITDQGGNSYYADQDERLSHQDEKNGEDSDWLYEYLAKIQDTRHEELVHVQQEMSEIYTEDVTKEGTLEGPNFEHFTKNESEKDDNPDFKPLYPGAAITVGLSALLIMTFALRHMLSGEALSDMLTLISAHCISPNLCMKSLYELMKHFHALKASMVFHKYCSYCFLQIDKNVDMCPNSFCAHDLTCSGNTAFFIEIPIVSQIREFFARPAFYDLLKKRLIRQKKCEHNIEAIWDGKLYTKHAGSSD